MTTEEPTALDDAAEPVESVATSPDSDEAPRGVLGRAQGLLGRAVEWFWRGSALARARRGPGRGLGAEESRALGRALACLDQAGALLRAPLSARPWVAALALHREAIRLATGVRAGADGGPWTEEQLRAAGVPDALGTLRALARAPSFDVGASEEELAEDVAALGGAAQALVRRLADERSVRQVLTQRVERLGGLVVVLVAAAWLLQAPLATVLYGRNIGRDAQWRVSSSIGGYPSSGVLSVLHEGTPLFHTNQEAQPWILVDLGSERRVRRIEIENRKDCCTDRAVPLAVEVSTDETTWVEVARHSVPFSSLVLEFPRRPARFVRVRALGTTYLHLDGLKIR